MVLGRAKLCKGETAGQSNLNFQYCSLELIKDNPSWLFSPMVLLRTDFLDNSYRNSLSIKDREEGGLSRTKNQPKGVPSLCRCSQTLSKKQLQSSWGLADI